VVRTEANHAADQEVILGPRTGHCIFEELCLVHVLVDCGAKLEKQRVFHVTGEFLHFF
jgi:hypothetical protein